MTSLFPPSLSFPLNCACSNPLFPLCPRSPQPGLTTHPASSMKPALLLQFLLLIPLAPHLVSASPKQNFMSRCWGPAQAREEGSVEMGDLRADSWAYLMRKHHTFKSPGLLSLRCRLEYLFCLSPRDLGQSVWVSDFTFVMNIMILG